MANPGYLRSTDGSDADDGSTWALANATIVGAMTDQAAGDRIWLSDNHDETTAGAITITLPGTLAAPVQVLCGDDAAEPPTALATGATIKTTTGSNGRDIRVSGSGYLRGLTLAPAFGNTHYAEVSLNTTTNHRQIWDCCVFILPGFSSSNNIIYVGATANSSNGNFTSLINCTFDLGGGANTPGFDLSGEVEILGGSVINPNTTAFRISATNNRNRKVLIDGMDLSAYGSARNLFNGATLYAGADITFRNCKLGASVNLVTGTPTSPGGRVRFHNCDGADTNYRLYELSYEGSITSETTIVRTGGATDGTTPLAWKMTTHANAEYPLLLLKSGEIALWNGTIGSAQTATIEIVHDSQGAGSGSKFQDDEIWLELVYLGTSGFPLATIANDAKADILATAANQADSSETWTTTGLATPVKQKLSVSFTAQEVGFIIAKVVISKASKTCYIDPKIVLT